MANCYFAKPHDIQHCCIPFFMLLIPNALLFVARHTSNHCDLREWDHSNGELYASTRNVSAIDLLCSHIVSHRWFAWVRESYVVAVGQQMNRLQQFPSIDVAHKLVYVSRAWHELPRAARPIIQPTSEAWERRAWMVLQVLVLKAPSFNASGCNTASYELISFVRMRRSWVRIVHQNSKLKMEHDVLETFDEANPNKLTRFLTKESSRSLQARLDLDE